MEPLYNRKIKCKLAYLSILPLFSSPIFADTNNTLSPKQKEILKQYNDNTILNNDIPFEKRQNYINSRVDKAILDVKTQDSRIQYNKIHYKTPLLISELHKIDSNHEITFSTPPQKNAWGQSRDLINADKYENLITNLAYYGGTSINDFSIDNLKIVNNTSIESSLYPFNVQDKHVKNLIYLKNNGTFMGYKNEHGAMVAQGIQLSSAKDLYVHNEGILHQTGTTFYGPEFTGQERTIIENDNKIIRMKIRFMNDKSNKYVYIDNKKEAELNNLQIRGEYVYIKNDGILNNTSIERYNFGDNKVINKLYINNLGKISNLNVQTTEGMILNEGELSDIRLHLNYGDSQTLNLFNKKGAKLHNITIDGIVSSNAKILADLRNTEVSGEFRMEYLNKKSDFTVIINDETKMEKPLVFWGGNTKKYIYEYSDRIKNKMKEEEEKGLEKYYKNYYHTDKQAHSTLIVENDKNKINELANLQSEKYINFNNLDLSGGWSITDNDVTLKNSISFSNSNVELIGKTLAVKEEIIKQFYDVVDRNETEVILSNKYNSQEEFKNSSDFNVMYYCYDYWDKCYYDIDTGKLKIYERYIEIKEENTFELGTTTVNPSASLIVSKNSNNDLPLIDSHVVNAGILVFKPALDHTNLKITGDYKGGEKKISETIAGKLLMNINVTTAESDLLNIDGKASGSTQIDFTDNSVLKAKMKQKVKLVQSGSSDINAFSLANPKYGRYKYQLSSLIEGNYTNWYLEQLPLFRPETVGVLAGLNASQSLFVNTFHDRAANAKHDPKTNVWARAYHHRTQHHLNGVLANVDSHSDVLQLGYDFAKLKHSDRNFTLGASMSFGRDKTNTYLVEDDTAVRSTSKGYALSIYATLEKPNWYVDSWLSVNRVSTKIRTEGEKTRYYTTALQASLETGYQQLMWGDENRAYYVEPQFQAIYHHLFKPNLDEEMEVVNRKNFTTRLGLRFYQQSTQAVRPYIGLNWWHHTNQVGVVNDDTQVSVKGMKNLKNVEIGVDKWHITPNLSLWTNAGYYWGTHNYRDMRYAAGLSYQF